MTRLPRLSLALLLAVAAMPACARQLPNAEVMGAYRFEDGRLVSIRRSEGKTLRARFYASGESRRLHPDGRLRFITGPDFTASEPLEAVIEFQRGDSGQIERMVWTPQDSPAMSASKVNRSEPVQFDSDGAVLSARLDLPTRAENGPPSTAVVLLHGSGSDAATEFFHAGDFMAAHGVATLTYDKRGTGGSEGDYTFDFQQLARDAAAAVEYLSSRPGMTAARIGLSGYSQGGWTAPLAASMSSRVGFVIVSYGLVASPTEEARVETRQLLRSRGVDEADLDSLDELTVAAVEVIASGFTGGWDELESLKKQYRRAPWLHQLYGTTVGKFVRYPRWLIRWLGPLLAPKDLPWHYDSMDVLEGLEIPMVWLLAENDTSAPIELALPMLESLQAQGKPIDVRVFPEADHSMLLLPNGYAPGYFQAEVEAALDLSAKTLLPSSP
ncbi:MAG: alpha/beta hydrolase [Thermoanaerobaculia bacterium]